MRSLVYVSPAILLTVASFFVLVAGLWIKSHKFLIVSSLAAIVGAGAIYGTMLNKAPQEAFNGFLVHDSFGLFFSLFAIFAVGLAVMLTASSKEIKEDRRSEFYAILLALSTGLIFMGISNHLLMAYIALETVSILSYTLAGFSKEKSASVEAATKYVIYGSLASAIMVYGISLLYGITGELQISGIRAFLMSTSPEQIPGMLWVSVLMIFAGIGYKISAAPMHMWTPDVYEGAPTPVTALLSVAPKAAGFAMLIRLLVTGFTIPLASDAPAQVIALANDASTISFFTVGPFDWPKFLMISSVFTMVMGNLAALGQTSVKRILAYSSIAHAGYMLMGLATQTDEGITAILFYLLVYCTMNLGAFWVTTQVGETFGGDSLKHFRGLAKRQPFHAVMMAIFLFSLVGVPPFAGFLGKFYLFSGVIAREMYGFALIAAINAVISLYYYVKIIKAMFLEEAEVPMPMLNPFNSRVVALLIFLLALPNIALIINWSPVWNIAANSVKLFAR
jgi:NADH-quinone oxidoreductase subunit N